MSAYIVNNETISVIAKAFMEYGVDYRADNYNPTPHQLILVNETVKAIAQSLLDANYKSVNARYREEEKTPTAEYTDIEINEGLVFGCLRCFNYQACEIEDYENSLLFYSLQDLEYEITRRLITKAGMVAPWGYGGHNICE